MSKQEDEDQEELVALYRNSGNLNEAPPTGRVGDNSGYDDEDDALDEMDLTDMLKEARKEMVKQLYRLVKNGLATPQDMANLRALLKDNGIIMGDPEEGAKNGNPKKADKPRDLPSFPRPEYDS